MIEKVLSIKNPWAWLICAGYKDVENRSWKTNYRGKILIHASKTSTKKCIEELDFLIYRKMIDISITDIELFDSAIIGECTIVDCMQYYDSRWSDVQGSWNEWRPIYHWVLKDTKLYDKPILNVKGRLGLWNYDREENIK